ncbi:hypothetical protein M5J20_01640 [Corynebacterium sp. TA-R-1]|uniref:Secreted protein n=1 Tax=Corynebacterium stercoris TaxID=2943490 RepID=A0ABT1FYR1_9CORY|nr:hypothetical protein [Corynebacterium stercoris]MCP1386904.1 hypothetical protein [Corynebacterium stercoris]
MNSNRVFTALVACVASAALLAGCSNEEEVRLGEPELDFPYTSATPTPTFDLDLDELLDEDEEDEEDTETETSESESESETSGEETSESTTTRTSTRVATRDVVEKSTRMEPVPLPPGAACAWPSQSEANGGEFSTFCNREWARTVLDGQQYFWQARGNGWVSVDPTGERDNQVCWSRDSFNGAPEAIRNAVVYCE